MLNVAFDNVNSFINSISFPKECRQNDNFLRLGRGYDDESTLVFERLILKRLCNDNKKDKTSGYIAPYVVNKLTRGFNLSDRLNLFVLISQHYFNQKTQEIFPGYESKLKQLAEVLGISKVTQDQILCFFSRGMPYTDKSDALYLAGRKASQLIKSKGVNVHFILDDSEEIVYLKYLQEHDLFLAKTFHSVRRANCILEEVCIKEMNILGRDNFKTLVRQISFDEAVHLINTFMPFTTIKVKATDITPEIILDADQSRIEITGDSTPLSPTNYFDPVFEWLNNYSIYGKEHLDLHFKLNVYNTYTSRFLYKLLTLCTNLKEKGKKISITWYYLPDDEDVIEFGNQLQSVVKEKFRFRSIKKPSDFLYE